MVYISDFADMAVVLPLVGAVWLIAGVLGGSRMVHKWALCVSVVWAVMLGLKLVCFALTADDGDGLFSPSGHTASACIVYGGLAWTVLCRRAATLAATVPLLITLLIGVSRLAVQAHTLGEVIAGGAVGMAGLLVLIRWAGQSPHVRMMPVLLVAAVVVPLLHGTVVPMETTLQNLILGP